MPIDMFDEDDILSRAIDRYFSRAIDRYFRDHGSGAMQPANSSTATYCRETHSWLVELGNVRGTLARYRGRIDSAGRVRFEEES